RRSLGTRNPSEVSAGQRNRRAERQRMKVPDRRQGIGRSPKIPPRRSRRPSPGLSWLAESIPNLNESLGLFGRNLGPETQEDLEGRVARTVEELKTQSVFAVEMARLLHGEE